MSRGTVLIPTLHVAHRPSRQVASTDNSGAILEGLRVLRRQRLVALGRELERLKARVEERQLAGRSRDSAEEL